MNYKGYHSLNVRWKEEILAGNWGWGQAAELMKVIRVGLIREGEI